VKPDVQLCSISGGTDIVSCFALGNPIQPVRRGELQGPGLGMQVEVFDDNGRSIRGRTGELVYTVPFPSMPLGFLGDPGGQRFHATYSDRFPGVWAPEVIDCSSVGQRWLVEGERIVLFVSLRGEESRWTTNCAPGFVRLCERALHCVMSRQE